VWLSLVAEAKRSSIPGTIRYTSSEALQETLGFITYELPFTLDEFLDFTGQLKQTAKRREGRLKDVTLTHYQTWQGDWKRDSDRQRQNRWRTQENQRDTQRDTQATDFDFDYEF
jgi:hypothetical protein